MSSLPTSYISVKNFGAKGDGITDDQVALQNAFNAARASGAAVYIPPGTYAHSGVLKVDSITVFGDGNDKSVLKATTYLKGAIDLNGSDPALYNLAVVGTGGARAPDRTGQAIYIYGADHYVVENVHVMKSDSGSIMTEEGSNGKILHNLIEGGAADGIYSTEGTYNLEVAYNKTINTGDDAISLGSYNSPAGLIHDINVHDNTVVGNWQSRSITVYGGYNITINHNYVDGGTAGISVGATTDWGSQQNRDITVSNNTIKNVTYTGEGTIGGGALHFYNNGGGSDYNINVFNNQIYQPAHNGIFVWGVDPITANVHDNKFYMDASHSLYVNKDAAATNFTQVSNVRYDASTYKADLVASTVGGIDPTLSYVVGQGMVSNAPIGEPDSQSGTPNQLTLRVSEDAYKGDARFTVSVDGTQAGGTLTASALHSRGDANVFVLPGNWGSGLHDVQIKFINDAYGGTTTTDRNLYVNSIAYDGVTYSNTAAAIMSAETRDFKVGGTVAAATAPADTLTLHLSEDAYNGNARFALTIDGKTITTPQDVTALHSAGAWQDLTFAGNFGTGTHTVGIKFANDAYGGSAATDRNLYVNGVDCNGTHYGSGVTALMSNGTASFAITTAH